MKVGETNVNKCGSKIEIIRCDKWNDVDILFVDYNWIAKSRQYDSFKNGTVRCPYEPTVHGIGYIGEGFSRKEKERAYGFWNGIIQRGYDEKFKRKRHTYEKCSVDIHWHNFQNFIPWEEENYYETPSKERMCLDKDILIKGNKIYSPQTCIFVPNRINVLFTRHEALRGTSPIGVSPYGDNGRYRVRCHNRECKNVNLGVYNNELEAFEVYKKYKEKVIKEVADEYKPYIPKELYEAMYRYEVEITD